MQCDSVYKGLGLGQGRPSGKTLAPSWAAAEQDLGVSPRVGQLLTLKVTQGNAWQIPATGILSQGSFPGSLAAAPLH